MSAGRTRTGPALLDFTIRVLCGDGSEREWPLKATGIEDAAERACRRVSLDRRARPKRTSGAPGEPGWFVPYIEARRFPFAGSGYHVGPLVEDEGDET